MKGRNKAETRTGLPGRGMDTALCGDAILGRVRHGYRDGA
jgi:hypothetical protein